MEILRTQTRCTLRTRRFDLCASRWPWQGYGWFPHSPNKVGVAPLNISGARFGGGWEYSLGICTGTGSITFDLLFGSISITRRKQ